MTTREALQDRSKQELYELAQEREIEGRSEMSKDELVDALAEEDGDRGSSSQGGGVTASEAVGSAREHLDTMVGRPFEGLVGVHRDGDGWLVEIEALELSRTPSSADVLAVYAVGIDDDGGLTSLERIGRHLRSEVGA